MDFQVCMYIYIHIFRYISAELAMQFSHKKYYHRQNSINLLTIFFQFSSHFKIYRKIFSCFLPKLLFPVI